ncbi:MAG: hypothetical protein IPK10_02665 [Bacteroidetes bacterium]|nr:hypothetical protein [Bacteroidota bacterium]
MLTPFIEPIAFVSLLTRLIVGFLFFIQGYDKIFKVGKNEVIATIEPSFQKNWSSYSTHKRIPLSYLLDRIYSRRIFNLRVV